MYAVST